MDLSSFYFEHEQGFILPVEHLGPTGMSADFAEALCARGTAPAWIASFDQAWATNRLRVAALYARAPETWFAPRSVNLCVVTEPERARPYAQPLPLASWLLEASDFDPESSSLEHAVYQLVHAERLGLVGAPGTAAIRNLSYWLTLDDDQVADFAEGCARSRRADAPAFQALAASLPRLRGGLRHPTLAPSRAASDEPCAELRGAGVIVPVSLQPAIRELVATFRTTAESVIDRYFARWRGPSAAADLCRWLERERPDVLVCDAGGAPLWDPADPAVSDPVREALGDLPEAAATSLRQDLLCISGATRRFLASLRDPSALPRADHGFEQEGGTYIHAARGLIAYSLRQPGFDPTVEPAPMAHRLLLAARAVHEWCHLAVDAGFVGVGDEATLVAARAEVAGVFEEIVAAAPPELRPIADEELRRLDQGARSAGETLAELPLQRMPDYCANLLAKRYLAVAEMEAYVRANVRTLSQEPIGPYLTLARYAYEQQYLSLSGVVDKLGYFVASSWFVEELVGAGVVDMAQTERLFGAVGRLCGCHRVVEEHFVRTTSAG